MSLQVESNHQPEKAAIYADARRLKGKIHEISSWERDPLSAIRIKPVYGLVKESLAELDRKISVVKDERLTKIWQEVFSGPASVEAALDKLISATMNNGETRSFSFGGTDLTVFNDSYQGQLPVNGIREKDYFVITKLCKKIAEGKTNIRFDCAPPEKAQVLNCLMKIMTYEEGRELIGNILSYTNPIRIYIGGNSGMDCDPKNPNGFSVELNLKPVGIVQKLPNGTKKSMPFEPWLALVHELIHVRHSLDGTAYSSERYAFDGPFDGAEEQRTIDGAYRGGLHPDRQSENLYLLRDMQYPRPDHGSGINPFLPVHKQIEQAVSKKLVENVKELLLEHPEEMTFERVDRWLRQAIKGSDLESTKFFYLLLRSFARAVPPIAIAESGDPLFLAAAVGSFEIFRWMAELDGRFERVNPLDGRSFLHYAASDPKKVEYLLQKAVNPDLRDSAGSRAIDYVLQNKHLSASQRAQRIQRFLENGAQDLRGLDTLLFDAVEAGNLHLLMLLLAKGISPNVRDNAGNTPLFVAASKRRRDMTSALIKAGADFHTLNGAGQNVLSLAFQQQDRAFLRLYAEHPSRKFEIALPRATTPDPLTSAKIEELSDNDLRLLLLDSLSDDALFARAFAECGKRALSLHFYDGCGNTPLHLAAKRGVSVATFERLLARSSLDAKRGSDKRSALQLAVKELQPDKVKLLLRRGGDGRQLADGPGALAELQVFPPTKAAFEILALLHEKSPTALFACVQKRLWTMNEQELSLFFYNYIETNPDQELGELLSQACKPVARSKGFGPLLAHFSQLESAEAALLVRQRQVV